MRSLLEAPADSAPAPSYRKLLAIADPSTVMDCTEFEAADALQLVSELLRAQNPAMPRVIKIRRIVSCSEVELQCMGSTMYYY